MRYVVRQKIFSFGDKFTIRDENEVAKFNVVGKVFTIGKKLDIYDMKGNHLVYIEQKVFRLLPVYYIYKDSNLLAEVKKEFTLFIPKYRIDSQYGNFTIDGDVLAHEFTISKNGKTIAWISKKWFAFSDTYSIDIDDGEDQAFILALVIVIDQVHHDNRNNNS